MAAAETAPADKVEFLREILPTNRTGESSASDARSTASPKVSIEAGPPLGQDLAEVKLDTVKSEPAPVRFVVPTTLQNQTRGDSRMVTIKMEPENLGAVRMTLSSGHDGLTARLVVETPMARTAVESNLNQLMDQLDRQGIKVDTFDISVGGGEVGKEFSGHRSSEFSKTGAGRRPLPGHPESAISITNKTPLRAGYIGAESVNCFA